MSLDFNVGGADKSPRILIGIALGAFLVPAQVETIWDAIAGVAAAIALVTASVKSFHVGNLTGVNTCTSMYEKLRRILRRDRALFPILTLCLALPTTDLALRS